MFRATTLLALPLAALVSLALPDRAAAVAPEILDNAKFFSPDAVKKANEQIREIARKHGFDLLIETFETVPGDQAAKVKDLSTEERTKFFQNWSKDRMNHHVVNGVYILICKAPQSLRVELSERANPRFGDKFINEVVKALVAELKAKKYDEALQTAVKHTQERLASSKPKK